MAIEKGRTDVGMDEAMAQKDRAGYTIDIANVTGGTHKMIGENTSQEVGNEQMLDAGNPFPKV